MSARDATSPVWPARPAAAPPPVEPATVEAALLILAQLADGGAQPSSSGAVPHRPLDGDPEGSTSRLRRLEARFHALIEQIPAVTFMAALDGGLNEVYVSPQIEALLGYTQEEWLSDPVLWFRRLHPDDRDVWTREFARGCATGSCFHAECRFIARDGSIVWVRGDARVQRDEQGFPLFLQGLAYDITESKRAEEAIRASLREKEILLQEVHHRVKNNLQITASLLRLQASRIDDETARRALVESQSRIRAISLVHDMLYRSTDLSLIDFAAYVRQLVEQLSRTYAPQSPRITARTELGDVPLAIDSAVPCGLLIHELVSNCFKHAFPGERAGRVLVRFGASAGGWAIDIVDDGAGFPSGVDPATSGSLGLELVRTLVSQLQGRLDISSSCEGTAVHITLPPDIARAGR
jgi:PAS domain S-box-containing protein